MVVHAISCHRDCLDPYWHSYVFECGLDRKKTFKATGSEMTSGINTTIPTVLHAVVGSEEELAGVLFIKHVRSVELHKATVS